MRTGWGIVAAVFAAVVVATVPSGGPASAQTFDTGFAQLAGASNEPIEIEADELEVRDNDGVAVFSGNVTVRQAGAALKTQTLTVHYVRDRQGSATEALSPGGNQEIARLEADGRVLVTAEGQAATGDRGFVDIQGKRMEIAGNVTLTQGENVVTGDKLVVDLNSGKARVESSSRVRVLLTPGGGNAGN